MPRMSFNLLQLIAMLYFDLRISIHSMIDALTRVRKKLCSRCQSSSSRSGLRTGLNGRQVLRRADTLIINEILKDIQCQLHIVSNEGKTKVSTHREEVKNVATEARDLTTRTGQEREHVVGTVRAGV